jgi:hypothetical protein
MKLELFHEDIKLKNTTYTTKWTPQAMFTAKSDVACMDFPKQESSCRNYLKSDYLRQDTVKARSLQDTGNTTGNPVASHWLWTTLVSSTSTKLKSTISSKHSSKTTKLKQTGKEIGILASHWTGTTRNAKYTSPCQNRLNKH